MLKLLLTLLIAMSAANAAQAATGHAGEAQRTSAAVVIDLAGVTLRQNELAAMYQDDFARLKNAWDIFRGSDPMRPLDEDGMLNFRLPNSLMNQKLSDDFRENTRLLFLQDFNRSALLQQAYQWVVAHGRLPAEKQRAREFPEFFELAANRYIASLAMLVARLKSDDTLPDEQQATLEYLKGILDQSRNIFLNNASYAAYNERFTAESDRLYERLDRIRTNTRSFKRAQTMAAARDIAEALASFAAMCHKGILPYPERDLLPIAGELKRFKLQHQSAELSVTFRP